MCNIARLVEAAREAEHRGDLAKAHGFLEQAVAIAPSDPSLWTRLGYVECDRQLYSRAIAAFERALKIDNTNVAAHTGISEPLTKIGRPAEALEHLLVAVDLDRSVPRLLLLGDLQIQLGMASEATETFRRAVLLEPDDAEALYNLARSVKQTNGAEAKALLKRALAIDPLYGNAYRELGSVHASDGAFGEAEDALKTAIQLNASDAWAHLQLANVLWSRGADSEAEKAYSEACDIAPYWSLPRYALGEFLESRDRPERAEEAYRRAAQIEPLDVEAVFRLGGFLVRRGAREEGIRWLKKAHEISPGHEGVANLLAKLQA